MQVMGPDDDTGYRGSWWEAKVLARKPTAGGGQIYTIEYSEVGLRGSVTFVQQRAECGICGCRRSHQPHTWTAPCSATSLRLCLLMHACQCNSLRGSLMLAGHSGSSIVVDNSIQGSVAAPAKPPPCKWQQSCAGLATSKLLPADDCRVEYPIHQACSFVLTAFCRSWMRRVEAKLRTLCRRLCCGPQPLMTVHEICLSAC